MKRNLLNYFGAGCLMLSALTACENQPANELNLSAQISGIDTGKVMIRYSLGEKTVMDSAVLQGGKFTYKATLQEPVQATFIVGERGYLFTFLQNGKMSIQGSIDSLHKAEITGCAINDDVKKLDLQIDALYKETKMRELSTELYQGKQNNTLTKEREAEILAIQDSVSEKMKQINEDFITNNPKSFYAAVLASRESMGMDAAGIEKYIARLDPSLHNTLLVQEMKKKASETKQTAVSFEKFIPDAHNLTYVVDKAYKGKDLAGVIYIAMLSNDNTCLLKRDGNVVIASPDGSKVAEFKSGLTSKPAVIATDKADNIYVLGGIETTQEKSSRGKTYKMEVPTGVECLVLDSKGKKVREIKLEGVTTATGVRISENNLLVADTRGRSIVVFDLESGAKKSKVENLRTCCGILDFTTRKNSEILVANLGNFRVDGFDFNGKSIISFGQRGSSLNDFHGCCNPVSVEFLSNGGIVTVEKDPTRIKVYSCEGAKKIEGIEELVQGCTYIPVAVDSKDNVYLASEQGGMVKCVSAK